MANGEQYTMDLNPRQQEAVEYGNGPLLIAAGAGSGKTKTLTERLIKLIERGVPPKQILAVTFTNKAAEEMRNRIERYLNIEIFKYERGPFIGTFHSLGARLLRAEAKFLNRSRAFSIFDEDDSLSLLKKVLKNLNFNSERHSPPALISAMSKVKNLLVRPEELLDEKELEIFRGYEEALIKNNAFDFDDLIEKVVRLFQRQPAVLKKYRERFRYVLVDEYQDVNSAQYELVRLLVAEHRNLSVVGDDSQAIYGWRYADFRNFLNFESDWPDAKIVTLEQNYRSTGNIISAASGLIKNNKFQRPKNLWTENHEGELIKVAAAEDAAEEADFIAEQIRAILRHPESEGRRILKDSSVASLHQNDKSCAILYRTNAQSRAIEQALIQNQIPYRIYGGVRFYERKEIKDILAGLRLALNPKDSVSAERLLKTLNKEPAERTIAAMKAGDGKLPVLELINLFLKNSRYADYLKNKFRNAEERLENIGELIAFASGFQTLQEFLERVSLMQSTDAPVNQNQSKNNQNNPSIQKSNNPAVQLMTIHMAKGLEFDSVFVSGVSEGLLPHQMSYGALDELEEERRLMYVAMTRARKNLCLSFHGMPSRFLYEIPPELTDFINLNSGSKELPDEDIIYIE